MNVSLTNVSLSGVLILGVLVAFSPYASAAKQQGCFTHVRDSGSPANVSNAPRGAVIATLRNGAPLVVTDDVSGWLAIASPVRGYVHESATGVYCGSFADPRRLRALDALATEALSNRIAMDALVRFTAFDSDGYVGEAASGQIGRMMTAQPRTLIWSLNQLPEGRRRFVLEGTIETGGVDDVTQFRRMLYALPKGPTYRTWRAMLRDCRPGVRGVLRCR